VGHRIKARRARHAPAPRVEDDPAVLAPFLSDAAHVPGGSAAGIAFPTSEGEVSALIRSAPRLLPVGAQSSLTGGATPRGDIVLSTRALTTIGAPKGNRIRVGAGVPLAALQQSLSTAGLYYPPVPTFDGAFVGGTISTNAAGAATFKYGSTRRWVSALTVVLPSGEVLDVERGQVAASASNAFDIESVSGDVITVQLPTYSMRDFPKLSAGYYARPALDLVYVFVGS
jgi:D-lactate dehydrogenase (cytochrome)